MLNICNPPKIITYEHNALKHIFKCTLICLSTAQSQQKQQQNSCCNASRKMKWTEFYKKVQENQAFELWSKLCYKLNKSVAPEEMRLILSYFSSLERLRQRQSCLSTCSLCHPGRLQKASLKESREIWRL